MIAEVDKDATGKISFNDFLAVMNQKMVRYSSKNILVIPGSQKRKLVLLFGNLQAEKDSKEEILKAFRLFDDDETGKISFRNLKRVAKELGENLTDEELQVQKQSHKPAHDP